MNREDIIRMAQECQLIGMRPHLDGIYQESLERFSALVAAHVRETEFEIHAVGIARNAAKEENEACAKVLDDHSWKIIRTPRNHYAVNELAICRDAIRARWQS